MKHTRPAKCRRKYLKSLGRVVREGLDERWVDYGKFKCFQISILWRASVASGNAFREIRARLSPSAKEGMRLALLTGKFDEDFMPCLMVRLEGFKSENFGIIQPPICDDNAIQFIFGGYEWHFFLNAANLPTLVLSKDGHLLIAIRDIQCLLAPDNYWQ